MPHPNIITGLDIGSTAVRIVVGQKIDSVEENGEPRLHIIGASEVPSVGVNKGVVTSIDDTVSAVSACLEKVERLTGVPIEHSFVSIAGPHILAQPSKGVVAVSKPDGEIKEDDVERVIEAAQAVATPPNYEIIHVIPRSFTVDGQSGIKDPVGMTGVRLEVDAQIILGLSSPIKNLTKAVYRTGMDIDDIVLSSLAASESTLTKRQKDLGVMMLDMGGTTTSLVVHEEGDVLYTSVLPVGSAHITSDIAIGLRTSIDVAEKIKLLYGSALPKDVSKREEIDLKELGDLQGGTVSKKHISEIIEARLEEIFDLANKELKKIDRDGLLPSGVVLTGGGAKLEGIVELAKKSFRLSASIGLPKDLTSSIDTISDPSFAVSLGLVMWGNQVEDSASIKNMVAKFSNVDAVAGKVKKWFQTLMP